MDRIPSKFLRLSAAGLIALALHEGYSSTAYKDTVGVWTIGFGETKDTKKGQTTTPQRALIQLLKSAEDSHGRGMKECLGDVELYQYEYDAYLDFTYNVGVHGFCTSTSLKLLKEGKYTEACESIMLWNKNKELIGRRKEEVKSCLGT